MPVLDNVRWSLDLLMQFIFHIWLGLASRFGRFTARPLKRQQRHVTLADADAMSYCSKRCANNNNSPTTTQPPAAMGNTQTSHTNPADEIGNGAGTESGISTKSRRGSRVKVFGRFGQKKPVREEPSVAPASTSAYDDANTNDTAELLQQSHAAVIRQLETEHVDFRKGQKKKKPKFLQKRRDEAPAEEDRVSLMPRQKRLAPKPPELTPTTSTAAELVAAATATTTTATCKIVSRAEAPTSYSANHREFIENLFDNVSMKAATTADLVGEQATTLLADKPAPMASEHTEYTNARRMEAKQTVERKPKATTETTNAAATGSNANNTLEPSEPQQLCDTKKRDDVTPQNVIQEQNGRVE